MMAFLNICTESLGAWFLTEVIPSREFDVLWCRGLTDLVLDRVNND
jgi:hypothetical protein